MAAQGCFGFSLCHWRNKQLLSHFRSSGLQSQTIAVDHETLIHFWLPCDGPLSSPQKPALILIQGFGTSPLWQWNMQIRPLQSQFRLFVPDLIFFGESTTASPHRSEVFQAQMIMKAMEALGVKKFSVAGTSYGGFVAFRMAHLFPQAVEKVVIANSGVCFSPKDNAGLLQRSKMEATADLLLPQTPDALRTLMSLSIYKTPKFLPSFILKDFLDYLYADNRVERVELLNGLQIGREGAEPLPTLSQKVLIIWGDHDGIFLPELANRLKEHLGEKAQLVIVKDTAHCVQIENPHEFNKLLQTFLLEN